jgi:hypothetical protein
VPRERLRSEHAFLLHSFALTGKRHRLRADTSYSHAFGDLAAHALAISRVVWVAVGALTTTMYRPTINSLELRQTRPTPTSATLGRRSKPHPKHELTTTHVLQPVLQPGWYTLVRNGHMIGSGTPKTP